MNTVRPGRLLRRFVIVVPVLFVLLVVCVSSVPVAKAQAPPVAPIDNPAYAATVRELISGNGERFVTLWSAETGAEEATLGLAAMEGGGALTVGGLLAAGGGAIVVGGAAYLTYKLVTHFTGGGSAERYFKIPTAPIIPPNPASSYLEYPTFGWYPAEGHYEAAIDGIVTILVHGQTYRFTGTLRDENEVFDPSICDVSYSTQTACYAPNDGSHTYSQMVNEIGVNDARWEFFSDIAADGIGSFVTAHDAAGHAGQSYGWSCGSLPGVQCGTHYLVASAEQLGNAIGSPNQARPYSGQSVQHVVEYNQPALDDMNLDAARTRIKTNEQLTDDVNDALVDEAGNATVVPDCSGLTFGECRTALIAAGITGSITRTIGTISNCDSHPCTYDKVESLKKGTLTIHEGDDILTSSPIQIIVEPNTLILPDCTGETYASCVSILRAAGLLGSITKHVEDPSECPEEGCTADKVDSITPAEGVETLKSGAVQVYVQPDPDAVPLYIPYAYYELGNDYWHKLEQANPSINPTALPTPHYLEIPSDDGNIYDDPCVVEAVWLSVPEFGAISIFTYFNATTLIGDATGDTIDPAPDELFILLNHNFGGDGCAEDGSGLPVPVDGGNCGPTIPPIDFDAFRDITASDKFPFGAFGFIGATLGPLVTEVHAPVFDVPISLPGVGEGSIHVDLSPGNPLMSKLRLFAAIGIGLTGFWILATSLLNFKAGSPGGMLDDEE